MEKDTDPSYPFTPLCCVVKLFIAIFYARTHGSKCYNDVIAESFGMAVKQWLGTPFILARFFFILAAIAAKSFVCVTTTCPIQFDRSLCAATCFDRIAGVANTFSRACPSHPKNTKNRFVRGKLTPALLAN